MLQPLVLLLTAAAMEDLRHDRIPNALILIGMGVSAIYRIPGEGWAALGLMLLGAVGILICLWPIYALGGLGAGDCKLLIMVGTFVPVHSIVPFIMGSFLIALPCAALEHVLPGGNRVGKVHFSVPVLFMALAYLTWGPVDILRPEALISWR